MDLEKLADAKDRIGELDDRQPFAPKAGEVALLMLFTAPDQDVEAAVVSRGLGGTCPSGGSLELGEMRADKIRGKI